MFRRRRRRDDDELVEATDDQVEDTEPAAAAGTTGPFDVDDAPDDSVKRLDLGSIRVPTPGGVNVQMKTDERGNVNQVLLVHEGSALQIGAFAAPRSDGIWDEVREEITSSVTKQGGRTEEIDGRYGIELLAHVSGPKGTAPVRFVGIDGPRWFVRGLFQGQRATDVDAAPVLDDCLRGLVVDRGTQAMPVREGLPLKLPKDMAERAAKQMADKKAEQTKETAVGAGRGVSSAASRNNKPSPRRRRKLPLRVRHLVR